MKILFLYVFSVSCSYEFSQAASSYSSKSLFPMTSDQLEKAEMKYAEENSIEISSLSLADKLKLEPPTNLIFAAPIFLGQHTHFLCLKVYEKST